ncbi:class I SAM-dependent methyltransferase [Maribellus sediminis]|uniref:class I SAM-dependent methyltransferase n=1 Tax=Maribellus sediminis TaxID=2696285 RepID=UPI00142FC35B|nr:class I SAM-dependent methyltransferase [Maribellus sediminis]
MNDFWNQRYSASEYAYGEEPNRFLVNELANLVPGKILFPAEGEGRNAVYAAQKNWDVSAFDPSTEGKKKALQLAKLHEVNIDYKLAAYENVYFAPESFDCLVLIFAHMPALKRTGYHQKLLSFLKPGGTILLQAFSKEQILYKSGGPRDIEMLYSKEELQFDFSELSELSIIKTETELNEGLYHIGKASVISLVGKK